MPAPLPDPVKEGDALSAAWLNALRAVVAELMQRSQIRVDGVALECSQGAFGTILRAGAGLAGGTIRLGKSPSGGIAAGATATVTLYQHGTLNTLGTETLAVTNPGPDACPGNRKLWIGEVNGVRDSVLMWSCGAV